MEERQQNKSKLSQLVVPILTNIVRKISRTEKSVVCEEINTKETDELVKLALDYPLDFVSQMKEVFREFDKVKCQLINFTRELNYSLLSRIKVATSAFGSLAV